MMEIFKVRLHYKQVDYYGDTKCKSYILIVGAKNRSSAEKIVNKKYKLVKNIFLSPIGTFQICEFTKVEDAIAKSEFIEEVFSSGDIGYQDSKPIIAYLWSPKKITHKTITTDNMRKIRMK
jgi:hypothetical protein